MITAEELLRLVKGVRLPWPEVEKGPNGEQVYAADADWADQVEEVLEHLASALERDGLVVYRVEIRHERDHYAGGRMTLVDSVGLFLSRHRAQVELRAARERLIEAGSEILQERLEMVEVRAS